MVEVVTKELKNDEKTIAVVLKLGSTDPRRSQAIAWGSAQ